MDKARARWVPVGCFVAFEQEQRAREPLEVDPGQIRHSDYRYLTTMTVLLR